MYLPITDIIIGKPFPIITVGRPTVEAEFFVERVLQSKFPRHSTLQLASICCSTNVLLSLIMAS